MRMETSNKGTEAAVVVVVEEALLDPGRGVAVLQHRRLSVRANFLFGIFFFRLAVCRLSHLVSESFFVF